MEEAYRITDPQVLKVVAHPLRVRMLGMLRAEGPATASQLARKVGESSGSTSYHLRELAKYGFIEEDPSEDGRERRWRSRHLYTSWDNVQMGATPEGREALQIIRMRQVEAVGRAVEGFEQGEWSEEWADAAGMSDLLATLPPAGIKEFHERAEALVRELEERYAGHRDNELTTVFLAGYPRKKESP
ncbi:helix-turn-helix domain-containing protein [Nonomuraea typhae]|uniref:helix-turn-helix domain-containing protein n=1 Tax=Nonomuraea typhae TaxID=2603600 RepID=UPI0012FC52BC|nr:helix-turn-helix domain-containing protein [Nonomuraea typhae]